MVIVADEFLGVRSPDWGRVTELKMEEPGPKDHPRQTGRGKKFPRTLGIHR